jgi:thymidylate synthase
MKVQMRSNDIFYGLTFDAPFFALVHQHVYLWLREKYSDLELGEYFHFADNIHFYERHFDLANQILTEWENPKEVYSSEYEMILQKPLFNINDDGSIVYTHECKEMMSRINKAVKNEDTKQIDYYNILSEYLNILIS